MNHTTKDGKWIGREVLYPMLDTFESVKQVFDPEPSGYLPLKTERRFELIWTGVIGKTWPTIEEMQDGLDWFTIGFGCRPDVIVCRYPQAGDKICGVEIR